VLKWIGKVLQGSVNVPEGVPGQWVARLEALLEPMDKIGADQGQHNLSRDMLDYVLNDNALAVLHTIGQIKAVGERLHLLGYHYGRDKSDQPDVYEHFDSVPPSVALRWARLLEACVAPYPRSLHIQMPKGVHWPEVLMVNSAQCSIDGWSSERPKNTISALKMEALLEADGLEKSALLVGAFATPVASNYGAPHRLNMVSDLAGYVDALARHVEAIRPLLRPADVAQRLHVLGLIEGAHPATLDKLAPEVGELSVANSKQVRTAAQALVRKAGDAMFEPLRDIARSGKPDQRVFALRMLAQLANERQNAALQANVRSIALDDKAPSVRALVEDWDASQTPATADQPRYEYSVPVIDWAAPTNLPDPKLLAQFWQEINESIVKANKQSREHNERMLAQGHKYPLYEIPLYNDADVKFLRAYLASDQRKPPARKNERSQAWQHASQAIQKLAAVDGVTPIALLKMLLFFDLVSNNNALLHSATAAFNAMHRRSGRPTLLELSQMMDEAGLSGTDLLRSYCNTWGQGFAADWSNDVVWPYFAHHIELVVQVLTFDTIKDYSFNRNGLFRALATLPSPPPEVVNAMFSLALGSGKTDRPAAQEALHNLQGKETRIIQALADGKSDARANAAQWLGKLRHAPAIAALEQAVAKEKHDVAKGAMLDALELLGQPVEKYLNRDALVVEATKSLTKGVPKDCEWFAWTLLPTVRWQDTKAHVPANVLQWMLVQAVKQKSPEPNAVLRKYCAMFDARDREQLGQFVLETWLAEDVRPIPSDEAMKRAQSNAQSTHHYMNQSPQYYQNSPLLGKSVEELTAYFLPGYLRQPQGSAIGSKGLLAVASACAAEHAAAPVQRYLKEWYGTRAGQGKALIAMLSWIEHPSATQLMLSIGSRFRTKGFQEEATKQAEALAERKGWTLAELADRTVPSAGFDETGTLELSYGQRSFAARLLPDFKVELYNPERKKIAALSEPRQDDDAELAKDSKKAFSNAKKELKSIVNLQTERLYEALCTERDWPYPDWSAYLHRHPVLRHLVQRLVWAQVTDGNVVQTFRPLDDGTLTDREDNSVTLTDDARIRLAHDSLLAAEVVAAWQQHLVDYEIKPLFQQLGKGTYTLPADKTNAEEIKDFEGHLIEAYALRGRALKLGYTRGAAEDGGWFHVYQKRFPTLGLEAVIEFTGNPLPEENRTVALLNLTFANSGAAQSWARGKMPLSKVPKVLLSECYNDLRLIASEGAGYDAEWQKKSEY
jgi:hypothetical protein